MSKMRSLSYDLYLRLPGDLFIIILVAVKCLCILKQNQICLFSL